MFAAARRAHFLFIKKFFNRFEYSKDRDESIMRLLARNLKFKDRFAQTWNRFLPTKLRCLLSLSPYCHEFIPAWNNRTRSSDCGELLFISFDELGGDAAAALG